MNPRILPLIPVMFLAVPLMLAQPQNDPGRPVPVDRASPSSPQNVLLTPPAGENQRVYGPTRSSLVEPEIAKEVSANFRTAYATATPPRIVVYVNRALVEDAGLKLTGRTERYNETATTGKAEPEGTASTTTNVSGENTYAAGDAVKPTLADQQTVREVERLFGRVFRNAGARLADQKAAVALLGDQPGVRLAGSQAGKEREALKQIADIAIEVLISSRNLTVRGVAGDRSFEVPDIQATAIRLSDSAILGQAAASDILGGGLQVSQIVRQFGPPDITEATAFALMEDMLTETAAKE